MSDIDLLPCPFCGGAPQRCSNSHVPMHWVLCGTCHASPGDRRSPLEAAVAWNSRSAWAAATNSGNPVAWIYDGPNGERYIREHRDVAPQQLVKAGWTETPLYVAIPTGAIGDILAERRRQIDREGYDPAHDDDHDRDLALPRAAACYALAGTGGNGPFWINAGLVPQQVWPYRWEWKPYERRRNLVRAGALIVAEIERVDRAMLTEEGPKS